MIFSIDATYVSSSSTVVEDRFLGFGGVAVVIELEDVAVVW